MNRFILFTMMTFTLAAAQLVFASNGHRPFEVKKVEWKEDQG